MTQIWKGENVLAVTKVQAGPCLVTQVKTNKKDGYNAVQICFGEKKEKNIKKPQIGHLKGLNVNPRYLREFRTDNVEIKKGDSIGIDTFEIGDKVQATATSKGRGFAGVVKRYRFKGMPATHGTKDQERMPGSAGAMGAARIFKGKRMPGRMGGVQISTSNLEIVDIDIENNILLIKGAIAGANKNLVLIKGSGELKVNKKEEKIEEVIEDKENKEEDKSEEIIEDKEIKKDEGVETDNEKEEVAEKEDLTEAKSDKKENNS